MHEFVALAAYEIIDTDKAWCFYYSSKNQMLTIDV